MKRKKAALLAPSGGGRARGRGHLGSSESRRFGPPASAPHSPHVNHSKQSRDCRMLQCLASTNYRPPTVSGGETGAQDYHRGFQKCIPVGIVSPP